MINTDKFNLLRDIMDRISKTEDVKELLIDMPTHKSINLGGEYSFEYLEIHEGELQQDLIAALEDEIERLEKEAERLKEEL